jgi:phosphoesterase RecJ-like protein
MRSQGAIDISKYAASKGGGGHVNAAGFSVEKPFDEAVNQVIVEVTDYING